MALLDGKRERYILPDETLDRPGRASATGTAGEPPPKTYLLSLSGFRLGPGQRITEFDVKTWGVTFLALCHVPYDWEVETGSAGMDGRLRGKASHGAAYLGAERLGELHQIALVALAGPVQRNAEPLPDGVIPATFGGHVEIDLGMEYMTRNLALGASTIELDPAADCPRRN